MMGEHETIVPTYDIEWDTTFYGGDYTGSGEIVQIPVSLVEQQGSVEGAFETFTGFHRCHLISVSSEESDVYGNGVTRADLYLIQATILLRALMHTGQCIPCTRGEQDNGKEKAS